MENQGKSFTGVTEVIDGNQYNECHFQNCRMIYRGGELPRISGCHFENCQWQFEDAAERTLIFMRQLYHGMGSGGAQLVEATLAQLRQPLSPPPAEATPPASN